jgi:tripartite-type tricarboxylate transporter receptor subunit TctC
MRLRIDKLNAVDRSNWKKPFRPGSAFLIHDSIIGLIAGVAVPVAAATSAIAQSWPTRPLTMVVPFAAGGASDVIARIVAEGMRSPLGQPVVVENVGGAGGMTGAARVAKATPDGY